MKFLKILGAVALFLAVVYVVVSAIAPSNLVVEKSVTVNAAPNAVFKQVSCFDRWPSWSPWNAMDSTIVNTYSESPCGLGAWNSWSGEATGEGKQVITELRQNEYLKTSLVFGGDTTPQVSEWSFVQEGEATKVTWNFIGSEVSFFKRPMNLIGQFFLSSAYESGLASLKQTVESMPPMAESKFEIEEVELPETSYLLVSGEMSPQEIGGFFAEKYGMIMAYMEANKVEMSGHPTGLYYNWTDTLAQLSAAIPVATEVAGTDAIEYRVIEAGKALKIDYYGAYDKSGEAHYAMDDHIAANGLEVIGAVREVYVTDPMVEPDTSKWLTQIIYPVK